MIAKFENKVRHHICEFIFNKGYAPGLTELANITQHSEQDIKQALTALAASHSLVLHPNSYQIWVVHPFALFPTLFWVKTTSMQWWGNCIWCSLGIASLANADTEIHTKLKGEEQPILIRLQQNQLVDKDYVVHFPIPAKKTWDNVINFCANTLVFKNEEQVDDWCADHNIAKGAIVPIEQVWALAKLWYSYYLDPNWAPKTPEIAEALFARAGLVSDFWILK